MLIFDDDNGKNYAVWADDHVNVWSPKDAYDASPVGLSGKKEGFYFANWLMPFMIPFAMNGVRISPHEYPRCLEFDPFPCNTCQFFIPETCPVFLDRGNMALTRKGFNYYRKLVYCIKGSFENIFDVAQSELLLHGRPLHFQVLSKILKTRYPSLGVTDRKLLKILRLNPIFFRKVDEGVYQTVPGVKKCPETPNSLYLEELFVEEVISDDF